MTVPSSFSTTADLRAAGFEPAEPDSAVRNGPWDVATDGAIYTHRDSARRSHRFAIVGEPGGPRFVDAFEAGDTR